MSRLYVVEPAFTITGGMADHRLPLRGAEVGAFAGVAEAQLVEKGLAALADRGAARTRLARRDRKWMVARGRRPAEPRHRRSSRRRAPARRSARAGPAPERALGNVGKTVHSRVPEPDRWRGIVPLKDLARRCATAASTRWCSAAIRSTTRPPTRLRRGAGEGANSIHLGALPGRDRAADRHLPEAHPLGDLVGRARRRRLASIGQPLIAPIWADAARSRCWPHCRRARRGAQGHGARG